VVTRSLHPSPASQYRRWPAFCNLALGRSLRALRLPAARRKRTQRRASPLVDEGGCGYRWHSAPSAIEEGQS